MYYSFCIIIFIFLYNNKVQSEVINSMEYVIDNSELVTEIHTSMS